MPDFKDMLLNIEKVFTSATPINDFKFVKTGCLELEDGKKLLIKKYEKRGFFYSLKFLVRKTRAERFWFASLELEKNDIYHPKVYAALIKRKMGIFNGAYLITEWVQNTFSPDTSTNWFADAPKRELFCHDTVELLCKIHNAGIFHSDTKLYNFFITVGADEKKKLGIWDLDGAVGYKVLAKGRRYKDLGRLAASFIEFYLKNGVNFNKEAFTDKILSLYEDGTGVKLNRNLLTKVVDQHLLRKGFI